MNITKNFLGCFLMGIMLFGGLFSSAAASDLTDIISATPTTAPIMVDDKEILCEAYNIEESNYFKIRDLAAALNGTGKQFQVSWNQKENAIYLTSKMAYTPVGGELSGSAKKSEKAKKSICKIYFDDVEIAVNTYQIGENNYLLLRDIASFLNMYVAWENNTIVIQSISQYDDTTIDQILKYSDDTLLNKYVTGVDLCLCDQLLFTDAKDIPSKTLFAFFEYITSSNEYPEDYQERWYNKNDNDYVVPVSDVTAIVDKYFDSVQFDARKLDSMYDSKTDQITVLSLSGFGGERFPRLIQKKRLDYNTLKLTVGFYDDSYTEVQYIKVFTIRFDAQGYQYIKISKK